MDLFSAAVLPGPCQVHYAGTLDDGTQFDSSRGREPLEFTVGDNRVIKGFSEIVEGLAQGGSRKQRVSPESAYGEMRWGRKTGPAKQRTVGDSARQRSVSNCFLAVTRGGEGKENLPGRVQRTVRLTCWCLSSDPHHGHPLYYHYRVRQAHSATFLVQTLQASRGASSKRDFMLRMQQAVPLCNKRSGNAGQKRADLIVQVPASSAPKEKLPVGAQVQLSNGMLAKVLEVTDEHITIDANPELAGESLTFDVELVKLQKVSAASPKQQADWRLTEASCQQLVPATTRQQMQQQH